ncbi:MAG: hypothetical protein JWM72_871 [Actinomycetia bacterium]|nr:hypothetical protein [Actinomycetes bacterium]
MVRGGGRASPFTELFRRERARHRRRTLPETRPTRVGLASLDLHHDGGVRRSASPRDARVELFHLVGVAGWATEGEPKDRLAGSCTRARVGWRRCRSNATSTPHARSAVGITGCDGSTITATGAACASADGSRARTGPGKPRSSRSTRRPVERADRRDQLVDQEGQARRPRLPQLNNYRPRLLLHCGGHWQRPPTQECEAANHASSRRALKAKRTGAILSCRERRRCPARRMTTEAPDAAMP